MRRYNKHDMADIFLLGLAIGVVVTIVGAVTIVEWVL